MMLPSGNDAAQVLAIHFGLLLIREALKSTLKKGVEIHKWEIDVTNLDMSNYVELEHKTDIIDYALVEFYREMNMQAAVLKLQHTHFFSAHGMHHDRNYSSAHDVARISYFCMRNSTFK